MQFVLKPANISQKQYHCVEEVYSLTMLIPNPRRSQLALCHLALPETIAWPKHKYYTYKGQFLKQPSQWYKPKPVAYTDVNHNFGAKSPVRPFSPNRRAKAARQAK